MSMEEFRKGLVEQYQGELIGEAFFSEMTKHYSDPEQQYKLATLLQLETETAARLRPAVLELGVDLFCLDSYQGMLAEFLKSFKGKSWEGMVSHLGEVVEPFVSRYREIAEIAPTEYRELAESMVVHEQSIQTFSRLELSGESGRSLDDVIRQLRFPLR